MLPCQSVFVNAFSIIVFYRRWLAACLSFDLLGLFAVDFMVALLLILSIAIFYGCPLFDTLLILWFLFKDAPAFCVSPDALVVLIVNH